ncbi:MAG: RnfABCDGE type electron transport complex subunit D [Deltaproteobacteria bacterium]
MEGASPLGLTWPALWERLRSLVPDDPRPLQLAFLLAFLAVGLAERLLPPAEGPLCLAAALLAQALGARFARVSASYASAAITGLGVALLLRSDLAFVPPLAAAAGVLSKFALRIQGRHLFNPANLGLCLALALTPHAWTSPAQWPEAAILQLAFVALGLLVVHRALRSDVSLAFVVAWAALALGRVLWLGQRLEVAAHELLTGSLLVFAFFMISDPKTTPSSRPGRLVFAAAVAALAFFFQGALWSQAALFWALLCLAPLVPLLDVALPAPRFNWPKESPWSASPSPSPSSL